jgi:hypothetical protein
MAFDFLLDYLHPLPVRVRPMFGCHAVYLEEKILFVTRKQDDHEEVNGLWLATTHTHHESLAAEFPGLSSVSVLNGGKGETAWRLLHEDLPDFESDAIRVCELIRNGDPRVGKIPKSRKSKSKRTKKGR